MFVYAYKNVQTSRSLKWRLHKTSVHRLELLDMLNSKK